MCGGISLELPLEDDDDGVFVGDGEGVVGSLFLDFSSSSSRKGKKSNFSSS
jgi:hypothetical protein